VANHCPEIADPGWWGPVEHESVSFAGTLDTVSGTVFRPADTVKYPGARPVVVVMPGYGNPECYVWWVAWTLGGHGYTTLVFTPTYPSTGRPDLVEAIDFMGSLANPYVWVSDMSHVGAIGHSASAWDVSMVQQTDPRLDAVVAMDDLEPDITPVVPAMGISSDEWREAGPPPGPANGKLAAFLDWSAAGVPTAEIVIAGADHDDFSVLGTDDVHRPTAYAFVTWFDRYLGGDLGAPARLAAPSWLLVPRAQELSSYYVSAVDTDEYACPNLFTC
jgi:hypothetical protein